jgi:probable addiction module antidote protein
MLKTTRFDAEPITSTARNGRRPTSRQALETGDAAFVRDALGVVARARGMAQVAKRADLNRESLYKALGATGNPEVRHGDALSCVALGSYFGCPPRAEREAHSQEAPCGLNSER